ncbi:hypothetical protein CVT26_015216 [Gymnopilus dilepis]|uniref:G domain-containing protein n=1 Tax=Gymnopilus dilepis TaxID=231916 RepID=A0A409WM39_9AGAR|nr:hypothetical protein CVT26_015216 [Gymnopilus dilepis]
MSSTHGLPLDDKDILILIVGSTGAGKSFFINALLQQQDRMPVGRGLTACTTEIDYACLKTSELELYPHLKAYRIILVDTPGFNDCDKDDTQILDNIIQELKEPPKRKARLGGIIYLHDIMVSRFDGGSQQNLQMLQKLCGTSRLNNVILATTKWGRKKQHSEDLHNQLIAKYWKALLEKGARVRRFDADFRSAWDVIDPVISTIAQQLSQDTFFGMELGGYDAERGPAVRGDDKKRRNALQNFWPFKGLFKRGRGTACI